MTVQGIRNFIAQGADMVVCTGGMSVDPDDRTPAAIRAAGGKVVTYGAPTFPGAMFLLAYIDNIPVLGLPGCVMYHRGEHFRPCGAAPPGRDSRHPGRHRGARPRRFLRRLR